MSSISVLAANAALDALAIGLASLHDGFPGVTGANELTGGSYARQTATFSAASGRQRLLSAPAVFSIPACTVRWISLLTVGGDVLVSFPNGGFTPKNFMSLSSDNKAYVAGHGLTDTTKIVFYSGTPPTPLVEGTVYFVRDATTDTFKVAATSGGTAIDLTAAPSFNCVVCAITEAVYPTADTHTLSTTTLAIPE